MASSQTPTETAVAVNGQNGGEAESSRKGSSTNADPTFHALTVSNYIFNAGYMSQQWADIQLTFFDQFIKLHRLILSQSPYLAHIMLNYQPGSTVHLNFADENITPESIHIALHHLYSPSYRLVNSTNARPVLAAAYLLEGMPELAHHAYAICRDSINRDTIIDYVHWVNARPLPLPNGHAVQNVNGGQTFGSVSITNGLATAPSSQSSEVWKEEENGRYGEWSSRLKQDIYDYLIRALPESLSGESLSSNPTLLSVYTQLPFDLFKHCIESPELPITPTQNRFTFAKKAVAMRKKAASAAQMEESVVLAIASEEGAVHITRKPKRTRTALWKVEG